MGSLINCQQVASWTSQEDTGEVVGMFFTDQVVSEAGIYGSNGETLANDMPSWMYYLIIKPMPGYKITRDLVTIQNISVPEAGISITPVENTVITNNTTIANYPNGATTYGFEPGGVSMGGTGMYGITMYDRVPSQEPNCENWVIVEIFMQPWFAMPSTNWTINLDFNGEATPCQVGLPDNWPYAHIVNDLHITNFDVNIGYDIHVAKYFDTQAEALNPHDKGNEQFPSDSFTYNAPPTYDPNGEYNALYPSNWTDGSLQSFQPCAYNHYFNRKLYNYLGPNAATATGFTYSTICNDEFNINLPQLYQNSGNATPACSNGNNAVYQSFTSHPNQSPSCMLDARADKWQYVYESDANSNPAYPSATLSSIDYPQLTPGDGKLPSKYVYYITVSNNFADDWELIADYDFVKVYKIYSVTGLYLECEDGNPTNALVSEKNIDTGALISNNSILDINSVELSQVDSKTVKVTIPFQSDFVWNLWDIQSSTEGIRTYMEINAIYVGQ